MQIGATSSSLPVFATHTTASQSQSNPLDDLLSNIAPSKDPTADLLRFLKMSPAEKMQYQWMASHKMSGDDIKSMSSEQRAALMKQMATELAEQAQQRATAKDTGQGQQVNILA
jgi:hypothetical protein